MYGMIVNNNAPKHVDIITRVHPSIRFVRRIIKIDPHNQLPGGPMGGPALCSMQHAAASPEAPPALLAVICKRRCALPHHYACFSTGGHTLLPPCPPSVSRCDKTP